jgi:hypothetical protein
VTRSSTWQSREGATDCHVQEHAVGYPPRSLLRSRRGSSERREAVRQYSFAPRRATRSRCRSRRCCPDRLGLDRLSIALSSLFVVNPQDPGGQEGSGRLHLVQIADDDS